MSRARQLIEQVHQAGGSLRVINGKVKAYNIPPDLLPELKAHKPDILRILTQDDAANESEDVPLLHWVQRMADFYDYDTEERAHALADCQINPEAWREIVQASRARWHWTLHGKERHPYLPTKETNP